MPLKLSQSTKILIRLKFSWQLKIIIIKSFRNSKKLYTRAFHEFLNFCPLGFLGFTIICLSSFYLKKGKKTQKLRRQKKRKTFFQSGLSFIREMFLSLNMGFPYPSPSSSTHSFDTASGDGESKSSLQQCTHTYAYHPWIFGYQNCHRPKLETLETVKLLHCPRWQMSVNRKEKVSLTSPGSENFSENFCTINISNLRQTATCHC